ncbi:MAG: GGDEF domain-containing protein [Mariprofundales bacterium]
MRDNLLKTYRECPIEIRRQVLTLIEQHGAELAVDFYRQLMAFPPSAAFLDHEMVHQRLAHSMRRWLLDVFSLSAEQRVDDFLEHQIHVGAVHARIELPMYLVNRGMMIIKSGAVRYFVASLDAEASRQYLVDGIQFIDALLDGCLTAINQAYLERVTSAEKEAHSLRMQTSSLNLSVECERMRAELFDWFRELLTEIGLHESGHHYDVHSSPFALWVRHKATFYFPHSKETMEMTEMLVRLKDVLATLAGAEEKDRPNILKEANDCISRLSWHMDGLIDHVTEEQNSKDVLTQLLSRRFLSTILQNEIRVATKNQERFGLLMLDLDDFKVINDSYGHAVWDAVLKKVGEAMLHAIRPTDFAFRYGGEEMLLILTHVTRPELMDKAERLRQAIAALVVPLKDDSELHVTASIGGALYDYHPDYEHTLKLADENLYRSKHDGKNRVTCG